MIRITGLWKDRDNNGDVKLSGTFGLKGKVLILKNKYKQEGDNQPDFNLYIVGTQQEVVNDNPVNDDDF